MGTFPKTAAIESVLETANIKGIIVAANTSAIMNGIGDILRVLNTSLVPKIWQINLVRMNPPTTSDRANMNRRNKQLGSNEAESIQSKTNGGKSRWNKVLTNGGFLSRWNALLEGSLIVIPALSVPPNTL
jgi:hypothetical protein